MAEEKDKNEEQDTAPYEQDEQEKKEDNTVKKTKKTLTDSNTASESKTTDTQTDKISSSIDPDKLKPGMIVRVHQKIREITNKGEEKERIQVFEGTILAKRGKILDNCRILVRKIASNHIGVEKIFPLASPTIAKIEIIKATKVRRAKLYFLRNYKKKLKEKKLA